MAMFKFYDHPISAKEMNGNNSNSSSSSIGGGGGSGSGNATKKDYSDAQDMPLDLSIDSNNSDNGGERRSKSFSTSMPI